MKLGMVWIALITVFLGAVFSLHNVPASLGIVAAIWLLMPYRYER